MEEALAMGTVSEEVEEVMEVDKTNDGLLEENRKLKATVKEQQELIKNFLQKQEATVEGLKGTTANTLKMFEEYQTKFNQLLDEIKALGDTVEDLRDRITRKWGAKALNRILKESLLDALSKEENQLKLTVEELKRSVLGPIKTARDKQEEEARKLRKLVATMLRDKNGASKQQESQKNAVGTAGFDAIEVFPLEIWELIFKKVSDPQDLWNCCLACPLFEDILHQWKTGWLLEQALPNMYRHLPTNKLLELRLISKGWNDVVDNFLEDHPSLRPHDTKRDSRSLDIVCPLKEKGIVARNCFVFNNKECFTFENSKLPVIPGRNPFVGRYVCLDIGRNDGSEAEDGNEIQYWEKLYEFLATVGKEILYLLVVFPYHPTSAYMINEVIQFSTVKLFQMCPNLRKFSMSHTMITEGNWNENENPFTSALKLETIWALATYVHSDVLLDSMLKQNRMQLRKLVLTRGAWGALRHLEWPNLAELGVAFPCNDEEITVQDLQYFVGMRTPRLTKLTLSLCGLVRAGLTFEYFLDVVHEVMSTTPLSTLRLGGLGGIKVGNTPRKESRLKSLELQDCCLPHSFDFLFGCFPFLENLTVFSQKTPALENNFYVPEIALDASELDGERVIDQGILELRKFMFGGEVYKSNIWEFLPLLKVFTYQWDVYTREGYEAYLRSREAFEGEG